MKHDHPIVQSPDKSAQRLLLLFHGVDDNPVTVGRTGSRFMPLLPGTLIVSTGGVEPYGTTSGRQWFPVQGVTEENRQEYVDAIMPAFIETVRYWQKQNDVSPQAIALIGFSRGSTMSLESTKAEPGLASRIIALNGRYTTLLETATTVTTVHLIHGSEDRVVELSHAVTTQEALVRAGGDVMLDIVENLGRAIDERSMQPALDHLRFIVPRHYFDETLSGGKPHDDDVITMI